MEGSEIEHSDNKVSNHKPINDLDIDTNLESEENSEEASPLPETMKYYSSSAGQVLILYNYFRSLLLVLIIYFCIEFIA